MGIEEETGKGDYVGYCVETDEGTGIKIAGPFTRQEALKLVAEMANGDNKVVIRVFAQNQGAAILSLIEAFNRREKS